MKQYKQTPNYMYDQHMHIGHESLHYANDQIRHLWLLGMHFSWY